MSDGYDDSGTFERVCEIVSHPTRQEIVQVLRENETPTTTKTVASELDDIDGNQSIGVDSTEKSERVVIALSHLHLPKMADAGLIDYDPETRTIRTNDTINVAYDILDVAHADQSSER